MGNQRRLLMRTRWRKLRTFGISFGAGCLLSVGATRAQADEPKVAVGRTSALSWVRLPGAEECIGSPALADAVEATLARRVFVPPTDAELSVEGSIAYAKDRRRFTVRFQVADREGNVLGKRELTQAAETCHALDDRLALVLSMLIDPEAADRPAPPSPEAAPAEPTLAEPILAAPPASPAASDVPRLPLPVAKTPWRWGASASFGGATGLVPNTGWLVEGRVFVTLPHWPTLRAGVASFLPARNRVAEGALAEVGLVSGEFGVCPLGLRRLPVVVRGCVSGWLGQLSGRGDGFPDSRSYTTTFAAAAVDASAELWLSRSIGVVLAPALVVPVTPTRLAYDDPQGRRQTLFESSNVSAMLTLGIAVGSP
ncbi:hypothetical protein AKJ09_10597 [Labilithrix luteola]|uniref:Uncharacterized protein n=1 Tax=Labilithrix luteola TaxID=1391654 RepID=A0A0K1QDU8_9BACT|nr:hypothetical protein [Labilithrix luteola]AKV03934.1 hypothetical protein AKJ09_10597 [Labilithrix luteola]